MLEEKVNLSVKVQQPTLLSSKDMLAITSCWPYSGGWEGLNIALNP